MELAQELRLGICMCTQFYRGQLRNEELTLGTKVFRLSEVPLNDGHPLVDINDKRPHLVLDVHLYDYRTKFKYETVLARIDLARPGSEAAIYRKYHWADDPAARWCSSCRQPVSPQKIVNIILKEFLAPLERLKKLDEWLAAMQ